MLLCLTKIKWKVSDHLVLCCNIPSHHAKRLTCWRWGWGSLLLLWSCFVPPHGSFPLHWSHQWTLPSLQSPHQPELPSRPGTAGGEDTEEKWEVFTGDHRLGENRTWFTEKEKCKKYKSYTKLQVQLSTLMSLAAFINITIRILPIWLHFVPVKNCTEH